MPPHVHGPSTGRNAEGVFNSRALQSYPSELNRWLAWVTSVRALAKRDWGAAHPDNGNPQHVQVLGWSNAEHDGVSLQSLNENFTSGKPLVMSRPAPGHYVHVDDEGFWSVAQGIG